MKIFCSWLGHFYYEENIFYEIEDGFLIRVLLRSMDTQISNLLWVNKLTVDMYMIFGYQQVMMQYPWRKEKGSINVVCSYSVQRRTDLDLRDKSDSNTKVYLAFYFTFCSKINPIIPNNITHREINNSGIIQHIQKIDLEGKKLVLHSKM